MNTRAFTLVEVVIAAGIMGFATLAASGLAAALHSERQRSQERERATVVAQAWAGHLRESGFEMAAGMLMSGAQLKAALAGGMSDEEIAVRTIWSNAAGDHFAGPGDPAWFDGRQTPAYGLALARNEDLTPGTADPPGAWVAFHIGIWWPPGVPGRGGGSRNSILIHGSARR